MYSEARAAACGLLLLASLALSCGSPGEHGSAAVRVTAKALVSGVTLTVSGSGISPAIIHTLVQDGDQYEGIIGGIPAGTGRTFTAQASDAQGIVSHSGSVGGVTISDGATAAVVMVLQQATAPTPFSNSVPLISGVTASRTAVDPSGAVALTVSASDPDGDPLSYAWSATGGTFSNASSATPTWTAPAAPGSLDISVTVSDGRGGQNSLSMTVAVYSGASGGAGASVSLNTWPVVGQVSASPGQVEAGQSAALAVTASDPDDDPLSHAWTDGGCGGTFSSASAAAPTWTAPAPEPAGGACTLSVTVSDGRGGSNSGSVSIPVAPPGGTPNAAPVLTSLQQSAASVTASGTVTFQVAAHDPEGGALTFAWSATAGFPGTPQNSNVGSTYTSQMIWTAPPVASSAMVTVQVSDPDGGSTTHQFTVTASGGYTVVAAYTPTSTTYFFDLAATSTSDVWAAGNEYVGGNSGAIHRYNGSTWYRVTGAAQPFFGIWAYSSTHVFAVGSGGLVLRQSNGSWITYSLGSAYNLTDVWGTTPANVYAVGYDTSNGSGFIYRFNGSSWSRVLSTTYRLEAVWGSGASDIYAVGVYGTARHFDGSTWSTVNTGAAAGVSLRGVWGPSASEVWILGSDCSASRYLAGSGWQSFAVGGQAGSVQHLWGTSASAVWAVCNKDLYHFNGAGWARVPTSASSYWHYATGGASASQLWAGGYNAIHRVSR